MALDIMMSFSMIYELFEWVVAIVLAGDIGQSYLGTQEGEWDAPKDMALATLGGFIAMLVTALVNWRLQRDFAAESVASLRSHDPTHPGEVKIAEMLLKQKKEPPCLALVYRRWPSPLRAVVIRRPNGG